MLGLKDLHPQWECLCETKDENLRETGIQMDHGISLNQPIVL